MCVFIIVSTLAPLKIHPYLFQAFKMSLATSYSGWLKDVFPRYTPGCMQINQNPHKAVAETSDKFIFLFFRHCIFHLVCTGSVTYSSPEQLVTPTLLNNTFTRHTLTHKDITLQEVTSTTRHKVGRWLKEKTQIAA